MVKELTAVDEVHHQVQVLTVLKGKLELHDEGVVQLFQNVPLSFSASDLIGLYDDFFFD